jgi:hypothetical protein
MYIICIILRILSSVKVKTPEIKCVLIIINVKIIANAVCEWNGQIIRELQCCYPKCDAPHQQCTNFAKILEPPQNSRCQKGNIKQVPQIFGNTTQNLVTQVTWHQGFVHPWSCV